MKKQIYFILTDENLFHPYYFLGVIHNMSHKKYKIVGVSLIKETYRKGVLHQGYSQYQLWGLLGFVSLVFLSLTKTVLDKLHLKQTCSIKSIASKYDIPFKEIVNVNDEKHLAYLSQLNLDVIVSSGGQIFRDELLSIPKIACINRHTALLPKYGGVLPVFWAMYHKEKEFGVSIHFMTAKVDQGDVVYQEVIPLIKGNSLFKNYILGFDRSIDSTIKALRNITCNKIEIFARFHLNEKQYFSFPTLATIKGFKKSNKLFSLSDIYFYLFR